MNVDEQKASARKILIEQGVLDSLQSHGKDALKEMLMSAYVEIVTLRAENSTLKNPKIILPN